MKVWIVEYHDGNTSEEYRVFDSYESAKECVLFLKQSKSGPDDIIDDSHQRTRYE